MKVLSVNNDGDEQEVELEALGSNEVDSYTEVTRVNNFVTSVIQWVDVTKIVKINEFLVTRVGNKVSQVVTKRYIAGVLDYTYTETINRSFGRVMSIVGVRT